MSDFSFDFRDEFSFGTESIEIPSGFIALIDDDGNYLTDTEGNILITSEA